MKKSIAIMLLLCMLFNVTAWAIPVMDTPEPTGEALAESTGAHLADGTLKPGVNAFTGTTAAKNFTEADLSALNLHGTTAAEIVSGGKLKLTPLSGTTPFYTRIYLPDGIRITRPALTVTDIHAANTMVKLNGVYVVGGGDALGADGKVFSNLKADSGENAVYYEENTVCLTMEIVGDGGTFNSFSNMAVIPYYQITYKNLRPDGTSGGEDKVLYYLGTEEEKAAVTASTGTVTGLPESYPVSSAVKFKASGYTLVGWALAEGGEAVANVPLANEDIELYPVWEEGEEPYVLVPGVNAFTGTPEAQNFATADAMSLATVHGGYAEMWTKRLRLYPNVAGTSFSAKIALPGKIDRPALAITDLHVMSTQIAINGKQVVSGSDAYGYEKWISAVIIDTGEENDYNRDCIDIAIEDLGMENVNIFYNVAVIPYYQITYKNILPDGTAGEDIVKYSLGKEKEKNAIRTASGSVTGIPANYTVDKTVKLKAKGYTLVGWSTQENASEAVTRVPFANKDIVLYPVWKEGEVEEPVEEEFRVIPGVNAFTGSLATQNFATDDDLALVTVYGGRMECWMTNRLRLYPNAAGASFSADIELPGVIDRPALTVSNLHVMSTQINLDGKTVVQSGDAVGFEKWLNNVVVDTGAETAYGRDYVDIRIQDISMENVNIFYNMAVIPYYRITYKNILPDGTQGEDVVRYYLGTEKEKAGLKTSNTVLSGLPTSYAVDSSVRFMADDKIVVGWSTEKNAKTPVKSVELANEDIVLYPIWVKYVDFTMTLSGEEQAYIGNTYTYKNVFSADVPIKDVVWTVDDETVATIDENGVLTPSAEGTVTVVCTSVYDPNQSAEMTVAVNYVEFEAEIIGADSITKAYRSETYKCSIVSGDPPTKAFIWSVDNEALASIDSKTGKLIPCDNGVVTVIATSVYNPSYAVRFAVTLTNQKGPKTLTYMPGTDDGSVTGLPEPYHGVGTVTLSKAAPVREGYVFMGWSPKKGKVNTVDSVYLDNDKAVYAVWAEGIGIEFNGEPGRLVDVTGGTMSLTDEYLIVKSDASGDVRLSFTEFNIDPSEYHFIEFRMAVEKWDQIQVYYTGQIERKGKLETYGYNYNNWRDAELYSVWGDHDGEGLDNWFVKKMDMFSAAPQATASWFCGTADNIKDIYIDITSVPNSVVYIDYIRLISKQPQEEKKDTDNGSSSGGGGGGGGGSGYTPKTYDTSVENVAGTGEQYGNTVSKDENAVKALNFAGVTDEIIVNFDNEDDPALFSGMKKAETVSISGSELTVSVFGVGAESPASFETYDIALDADSHRYVIVKAKTIDVDAKYLRMYFVDDGQYSTFSSERSAVVRITDEYSMLIFDMSAFGKWKGTVSRLLFTLIGNAVGTVKIDWILFTNEVPKAMSDVKGAVEVFPIVNDTPMHFADVGENDWFADDVSKAYRLGFVKGVSEDLFDPDGNLTVAEAVTVAVRLGRIYNGEEPIASSDIEQPWYAPYVSDAVSKGIIAAGQFADYDKPVTRKEMAVIIGKALPASWFNAINVFDELPDLDKTDKAFGPVIRLYRAGVIIGSDAKYSFLPDTSITRAELAAILVRCAVPESRKRVVTDAEREKMKKVYYADDMTGGKVDMSGFHWYDFRVKNGMATAMTAMSDPIIYLTKLVGEFDGSLYTKIRIGMKWDREQIEHPVRAGCQIFFQTPVSGWSPLVPDWDGTVDEDGVGEFVFNLRSNSKTNTKITVLRFDPFDVADAEFAIKYIIIE